MKVPQIEFPIHKFSISRLVYGIWRLHEDKEGSSPERILEKIELCLSLGIDTFDHADIYGGFENEELFGKALSKLPSLKSKIKIITKCGIQIPGSKFPTKHYNTSKEHIRYSVERSLRKLTVDKLDVVLIHRPDPLMDPYELAEIFEVLITEGKVNHFGVSNFTPSQFQMLQSAYRRPLFTNQVEFHPFRTEPLFDGTFDQILESRIHPMIWSPTAGGRIFVPKTEREVATHSKLQEIAKKYGSSADQVLYSWFLNHPAGLVPILGTNEPKRIQSAAECFSYPLTRVEWFSILEAARGKEVA
ncbi:aldo/keto reductase [Leptospira brenneri]|uniref:Oxidoreductase n=1 Tax=Leptospira brenneri TaxID=2023182 RepID=A0A2M9XXG2_9LEPT|nr:aldo/keto reductase [Leptospira brenneri]PJZ43969.1 oxidoreductase [Leptospira brenneri]TGK95627.1 oxidoreductase [Leptospira brenneri]